MLTWLACSCPLGCPLEGPEWQTAEDQLHAAYRSQDPEAWQRGLAAYERFALNQFTTFEKEHRHA